MYKLKDNASEEDYASIMRNTQIRHNAKFKRLDTKTALWKKMELPQCRTGVVVVLYDDRLPTVFSFRRTYGRTFIYMKLCSGDPINQTSWSVSHLKQYIFRGRYFISDRSVFRKEPQWKPEYDLADFSKYTLSLVAPLIKKRLRQREQELRQAIKDNVDNDAAFQEVRDYHLGAECIVGLAQNLGEIHRLLAPPPPRTKDRESQIFLDFIRKLFNTCVMTRGEIGFDPPADLDKAHMRISSQYFSQSDKRIFKKDLMKNDKPEDNKKYLRRKYGAMMMLFVSNYLGRHHPTPWVPRDQLMLLELKDM